jgi:hypothetical protein
MDIHIHIDDRLVKVVETLTRPLTRGRLAGLTGVSVLAASFVAGAEPIEREFDFQPNTPILAEQINKNFEDLFAAINDRQIRDERVIEITQANGGCEQLINELNALEESRILPGGSVTFEVAADEDVYVCPDQVQISHVDGQRISIVGAGDSRDDVTFSFPGTGFRLDRSKHLASLTNLTLAGQRHGSADRSGFVHRYYRCGCKQLPLCGEGRGQFDDLRDRLRSLEQHRGLLRGQQLDDHPTKRYVGGQ